MDALTLFFSIFVFAVVIFATLAIWSPRRFWVKVFAVLLTTGILVMGYIGFSDLLSRPKPVKLELLYKSAQEAVVLGMRLIENRGIYLLLQLPQIPEPRYYVLPWDIKLAEQLQKEKRKSDRNGTKLMLKNPFKYSWDALPPMPYAMPQLAAPLKNREENGPQILERPKGKEL